MQKYEGNFKKGLRDGKGLMTAPNGYYYKGALCVRGTTAPWAGRRRKRSGDVCY